MAHLVEDLQFAAVLGGGGSLISLAICRIRYAEDWLSAWLAMTKAFGFLAIVGIAASEHGSIPNWWSRAPFSASASVLSSAAWGLTVWLRKRNRYSELTDLRLGEVATAAGSPTGYTWMIPVWAVLNALLFLYSLFS